MIFPQKKKECVSDQTHKMLTKYYRIKKAPPTFQINFFLLVSVGFYSTLIFTNLLLRNIKHDNIGIEEGGCGLFCHYLWILFHFRLFVFCSFFFIVFFLVLMKKNYNNKPSNTSKIHKTKYWFKPEQHESKKIEVG